jgi:hypothetical protein
VEEGKAEEEEGEEKAEEEAEEGKEKAEEGRGCPWPCGMLLRFLPVSSLTVLTPLRHVLLHALHAVTMNIRRSITAPSLYEGEAEDEGGGGGG